MCKKEKYFLFRESSALPSGSIIHLKDHRTQKTVILMASRLLLQKATAKKGAKEKADRVKSRRKQMQASRCLLPVHTNALS